MLSLARAGLVVVSEACSGWLSGVNIEDEGLSKWKSLADYVGE